MLVNLDELDILTAIARKESYKSWAIDINGPTFLYEKSQHG
jgi:hypothetical protein